ERLVLRRAALDGAGEGAGDAAVLALAGWQPSGERAEVPFFVSRVILQDLTGVPLLVDLAAMREEARRRGLAPGLVEPLVPVDMVIDHSVMIDSSGEPGSLEENMRREFERNAERYAFMKWAVQAFKTFSIVPPGFGIVHQVNLEHLARGVVASGDVLCPDTVVGTDSHTTMVNGMGVLGWGVGGIEAEAAMLGQAISMLVPDVVGVRLAGRLAAGVSTTDLALAVTQLLRARKVVGKFVEFFGDGAARLTVPERATLANMAPEYGATAGYFAPDAMTVQYLRDTGRPEELVRLFEAYYRAQGLFAAGGGAVAYSETLEVDLASVRPSVAGPRRPNERMDLADIGRGFEAWLARPAGEGGPG
ncbi:MAG: aconitate hydratase, partial [Duodenibacillus sp.]|nr:aconitate hydratase [Duodenibacillus sp.]